MKVREEREEKEEKEEKDAEKEETEAETGTKLYQDTKCATEWNLLPIFTQTVGRCVTFFFCVFIFYMLPLMCQVNLQKLQRPPASISLA